MRYKNLKGFMFLKFKNSHGFYQKEFFYIPKIYLRRNFIIYIILYINVYNKLGIVCSD